MMCPVCDKGVVIKIRFRRTRELAAVCDMCDSLWFEPEYIHSETAHTFHSFTRDEEFEYVSDDQQLRYTNEG